jgi:hypothetical protein
MNSRASLNIKKSELTRILILIPAFMPSTIIGILKPLQILEKQNFIKIRVAITFINHFNFKSDIKWANIVVFCRNSELKDLELLYYAKKNDKKIVYELDDNFFEIPLSTDIGIHHRSVHRLHVVRRFIELSDEVRIYSSHLKKIVGKFTTNNKINLINSYFEHNVIRSTIKDKRNDSQIRIAYPTGRIDDPTLENLLFLAMKKIMTEYPDTVIFYIWRKSIPNELHNLPNLIKMEQSLSYNDFIKTFYLLDIDIGLAPVLDHPFYWSKTNNKYREYAGCGIPGVYSNTQPYSNSVENNVTGILVENSIDSWYTGIKMLINNKGLRTLITRNSSLDVINNYSFDSAIQSWKESFYRIKNLPLLALDWLPDTNKIPIIALLDFRNDSTSKIIAQQIFDSAFLFKGSFLDRLSSFEDFLKSPFKNKFCAIFVIDDGNINFDMLEILQSHNKNKIFIIHKFNSTSSFFIKKDFKKSLNYTYLILRNEFDDKHQISTFSPLKIKLLNINDFLTEKFSLDGNMAVFIDLIEKSIIDSAVSSKTFISKFSFAYPIEIKRKFARIKNIFNILTLYIQWRLGLRRF